MAFVEGGAQRLATQCSAGHAILQPMPCVVRIVGSKKILFPVAPLGCQSCASTSRRPWVGQQSLFLVGVGNSSAPSAMSSSREVVIVKVDGDILTHKVIHLLSHLVYAHTTLVLTEDRSPSQPRWHQRPRRRHFRGGHVRQMSRSVRNRIGVDRSTNGRTVRRWSSSMVLGSLRAVRRCSTRQDRRHRPQRPEPSHKSTVGSLF